jgi:CheY-like chemotaxis protein
MWLAQPALLGQAILDRAVHLSFCLSDSSRQADFNATGLMQQLWPTSQDFKLNPAWKMVEKPLLSYNIFMEMKKAARTTPLKHKTDEFGESASLKAALVLVVDDTVDNLTLISLELQGQGYRVVTASDGEEAVKVAALSKPDIILMDIAMPHVDGLEATRKIRENADLRAIPVIAITAYNTGGFQRAAHDAGFDAYLTKPLDFPRLHSLIETFLQR